MATAMNNQGHLDRLINDSGYVEIANIIFVEELLINSENYLCVGIKFTNCTFKKSVFIQDLDLKFGLEFERCEFSKNLNFRNCSANEFSERYNNFRFQNSHLYFFGTNVYGGLQIGECKFERALKIDKESSFENLQLVSSYFDSIDVENSNVERLIDINDVQTRLGCYFRKSKIDAQVRIFGCKTDMSFIKSDFNRDVYLSTCHFTGIVTNDGSFIDDFKVEDCDVENSISLIGTKFQKPAIIRSFKQNNRGVINNIFIEGCDFDGEISFEGSSTNKVINIQQLYINCSSKLLGNIKFNSCRIKEVKLVGANSSSLFFNYCYVDNFNLINFINTGSLILIAIEPNEMKGSELSILQSFLGSAFFSQCNLYLYSCINILNSSINQINSSSTIWFDKHQLNPLQKFKDADIGQVKFKRLIKYRQEINNLREKTNRDIFRQLKFVMDKQGDNIDKLLFNKWEMISYKKELNTYKFSFNNAGDNFVLWLNQSNDFGNNWIKPIGIIFIVTIFIFYPIIAICFSKTLIWKFSCESKDIIYTFKYLFDNLSNIFILLNPARRISELFEDSKRSFGVYFWDFFQRIVLSYLIFQTIKAFRKYV